MPRERKEKRSKKSKKSRSRKLDYKMTFKNKKPAGVGWKLDGTGYDLIKNKREYFWYR
jgi:hypothetical protein